VITFSIVIPAFDEQKKIGRDVQAAALFIDSNQFKGEVIVVDDGSLDNTANLAREAAIPPNVDRIVIRNDVHHGKGHAIRTGVLESHGEYVLFADSGLTVPFQFALKGMELVQGKVCELAHGSRKMPGSVIHKQQDWDRKVISALFHTLTVRLFHLPSHLTDTQCGFKLYRGEIARELYAECLTEGFVFDIEIIIRALKHGYRIVEFPVEWTCDRDSRIGIRRSSLRIIKELLRIRRISFTPAAHDQT
jgi:dolichyl-phosphate beta-glucosyltransferase